MMINHERWEDNEWDYSPDAHEPMEMPQEWVYTDPNEGPKKRDPFAEIFTGENSIVNKISKGIADALDGVPSLEEWLKPVEEAAKNLIRPVENRVEQVEELQLSAEEQLALLDGVRGFAYAVQSANVSTRKGTDGMIQLPLTQWGASKGAYVTREGIVIQEPGVWQINAFISGRSTLATPALGQQDSTFLSFQGVPGMPPPRVLGDGGAESMTINASFVVRIPYPTVIRFWAWSSRWRYFEGGTKYSNFSVIKHDSRLGETPPGTVPDEPEE